MFFSPERQAEADTHEYGIVSYGLHGIKNDDLYFLQQSERVHIPTSCRNHYLVRLLSFPTEILKINETM